MVPRLRRAVAVLAALAALATSAAAAPDRPEVLRQKFSARINEILFETGTERVKVGLWCRDAGLVAQATASFLRAVEESQGKNWWAVNVIAVMRKADDKFWKSVNPHPSKAYLDTFEKKGRAVDEGRQEKLFKLARNAHKLGLVDEAQGLWADLVRETDKPLGFDDQGRVVLPSGSLPEAASARMKAEALTINGQLYARDSFLVLAPQVKEVREAAGERVRIRIQGPGEPPADLLASLEALMPYLEDDLGGRPTRRIAVFVFQDRKTFRDWLDAAKLSQFGAASGLADGATNTAIVCADGVGADGIRGMCMHEMSHLFMYGVTPVVMPSWYAEGFAETYGGEGTFAWKEGKLSAGGPMAGSYLAPLRTPEGYIPLADLLAGDALKILTKDRGGGRRFYSESWAFLRWIRTASPPDTQARFRLWETSCRGAALGAQAGKPREQDADPAVSEFRRRFGPEVPAMEAAFREWLAKLP